MRAQGRFSRFFHGGKSMTVGFTIGNKDWNIGFLRMPELSSQEFILFFVISFLTGTRKAFGDLLLF